MAFFNKALQKHDEVHLENRTAVTFYRYVTADPIATVDSAGYFNSDEVRSRVAVNSVVQITHSYGLAEQATVFRKFTAVPASGDVTIA